MPYSKWVVLTLLALVSALLLGTVTTRGTPRKAESPVTSAPH